MYRSFWIAGIIVASTALAACDRAEDNVNNTATNPAGSTLTAPAEPSNPSTGALSPAPSPAPSDRPSGSYTDPSPSGSTGNGATSGTLGSDPGPASSGS